MPGLNIYVTVKVTKYKLMAKKQMIRLTFEMNKSSYHLILFSTNKETLSWNMSL